MKLKVNTFESNLYTQTIDNLNNMYWLYDRKIGELLTRPNKEQELASLTCAYCETIRLLRELTAIKNRMDEAQEVFNDVDGGDDHEN